MVDPASCCSHVHAQTQKALKFEGVKKAIGKEQKKAEGRCSEQELEGMPQDRVQEVEQMPQDICPESTNSYLPTV